MIKIDFEFDSQYGVFRDALHLPDDHGMTEAEIQAMKEQRRDNWIALITAPSIEPPVEMTKEVGGEIYQKLEGVPPSGAKLVEIDGAWFYKV